MLPSSKYAVFMGDNMEDQDQTDTPAVMDKVFSWAYWIRIALSPILGAVLIAGIVLVSMHSVIGAVLAAVIFLGGCVMGYRMAENARKTIGTVEFAAKAMHNVEFDASAKIDKL